MTRPGSSRRGWRRGGARLLLAMLAVVLGLARAPAQELPEIDPDQPVTLIADTVTYDSTTGELIAEGAVEVYYGPRTLTADRIVYDDRTGRIRAEGEIVLRDETGATVYASLADLDAELRDGLVVGAQALLDPNTRLAAVEGRRIDDRYNVLSKAAYSPCRVCEEDPTPLWRIRARRVIHDQEARVVHYEGARFEVFGLPIAWIPYFSHPDPTVERATGFLAPKVSSSSNYGFGVEAPFYIVVDEQTDVTLTPFVLTDELPVGQVEVRRAFASGTARFSGSFTRSDFTGEDEWHGAVDTAGRFRLGERTRAGWDIRFASDDDYLRFYDFSNEDRLVTELYVERYAPRSFFDLSGLRFQSLREGEPAGQIPLALPDFEGRLDFDDPWLGGDMGAIASAQGLYRSNGQDTGRISLGLDWEREEILPVGLALRGFGEVRGDVFFVGTEGAADVSEVDEIVPRLAPLAGIEARFPLVAESGFLDGSRVSHVLEPIAQAIVAPYGGNGEDIPNEDSRVTEFDELNLFDRNRFSGIDGFEEGPRFNLGLRYALLSGGPVGLDATVGRVLRFDDADEFTAGSGLRNAESDWVAAWSAAYDPYVTVRQRLRIGGDDGEVTRNGLSVDLRYRSAFLGAEYNFLAADPAGGIDDDREEIAARVGVGLTRHWSVNGFLRHDLEADDFVFLGGGLRYADECIAITGFIRRDFTDTENAPASTSFGVEIELLTLGGESTRFGGGSISDLARN